MDESWEPEVLDPKQLHDAVKKLSRSCLDNVMKLLGVQDFRLPALVHQCLRPARRFHIGCLALWQGLGSSLVNPASHCSIVGLRGGLAWQIALSCGAPA